MVTNCELDLFTKYKKHASDVMNEFKEFKERYDIDGSDDMSQKIQKMLEDDRNRIVASARKRELGIKRAAEIKSFLTKGANSTDKTLMDKVSNKVSSTISDLTGRPAIEKSSKLSKTVAKNADQWMQNTYDRGNAIADEFTHPMYEVLRTPGMEKMLQTEEMNLNIYKILRGEAKFPDKSPFSIAAKGVKNTYDLMHKRKRMAGYDVQYREGYTGKQLYKKDAIAANPARAKELIMDPNTGVDWKAQGYRTLEEFSDEVDKTFAEIQSPRILIDDEFTQVKFGGSKGIEASRSFNFKTAEGAYGFQKEFGANNVMDQLLKTIQKDAQKIGVAEHFGPDSKRGYATLMAELERIPDEKIKAKATRQTKDAYDFLTGKLDGGGPPITLLGKLSTASRQITDMSLLSANSLITTSTDTAFGAGTLNQFMGGGKRNFGNNWLRFTQEQAKLFASSKSQTQEFAHLIGAFAHETNQHVGVPLAREGIETGGSWKPINRMHKFSMAATGLPRQATAAKTALSKLQAIDIGSMAGKTFDELHPNTRAGMEMLNISADDWNIMRTAGLDDINMAEWRVGAGQGKRVGKEGGIFPAITATKMRGPDGLQNLELAGKYVSLLRQTAETGSPTGSLKVTVLKNMHSQDTVTGMAIRHALQYKSFAIAAANTMKKIGQGENALQNIALTSLTATALGASVIQANSLIKKGKFTKMDKKFTVRAVTQSGAGGLLGDTILTDWSSPFSKLAEQATGPAMTNIIQDTAALAYKTVLTPNKVKSKDFKKYAMDNNPATFFKSPVLSKKFFSLMKEL